jgi:hypothetical protein
MDTNKLLKIVAALTVVSTASLMTLIAIMLYVVSLFGG